MDTWSKCKICLRDFLDEAQRQSVDYRKEIIETGSVNLFDELVVWSDLKCDEPLPFCHLCIETIEKIKSLSNGCKQIQRKIDDIVSKLAVESLRTRKVVKSSGELLTNYSRDVKLRIKVEEGMQVNSNCVVCYSHYLEGKTCPEFSSRDQKQKILKSCKYHLMEPLRKNECDFDWDTLPQRIFTPFCRKCSVAIVRIGELASKLEHEGENLYTCVNLFSVESLKLKTRNIKKGNSSCSEQESRGGGGEDGSVFLVDDTADTTEVIEFMSSDEDDEEDVVTEDPLVIDPNQNTLSDNTADSGTMAHHIVSTVTATHHMSTSFNVILPNAQPAQVASRHESLPLQNQSLESSYYDYHEDEEQMEGDETLRTGRIINDLLESVTSPEQPCSSRKALFRSSTRGECMNSRDDVFACPNCKVVFIREDTLANHMIQCGRYTNDQENETYDGMPNLIDYSHYPDVQISENRETLNGSPASVASSDCVERFDTASRLTKHVTVSLHALPKPFSCKHCGESFNRENLLRSHSRSKNACKYKPRVASAKPKRVCTFQCKFCPLRFAKSRELSQHYQRHYNEALDSRCTACRFVYSNKQQLRKHLIKIHGYCPKTAL